MARPPSSPALRPLWVGLGFVLTGVGVVGVVLPGLPGTGLLVLAAACFARGNPRWEAWLLSRPVIGALVRDYRAGRGMPLRAKWAACACIALAVAFSLSRLSSLPVQGLLALAGLVGVLYILLRVPTRRP